MAFDGITLHTIVNELEKLKQAKVNSIFEPDKNSIVIGLYNGNSLALNIDISANNYRIHITTHTKKNPEVAPNFCMTLRKYLVGSKINNIYMKGLERICYIDFLKYNEMNDLVHYTLIIELMGKYSNIILVNEKNRIIDAIKKFDAEEIVNSEKKTNDESSKRRSIMTNREYVEPLNLKQDITKISKDDFIKIVENLQYKTIDKALTKEFTGISKAFVMGTIENLKLTNTVSKSNLNEIYDYIFNILNDKENLYTSIIGYNNDYIISYTKDETFENENNLNDEGNKFGEKENILDSFKINFIIDDFYDNKTEKELFISFRNSILKVIENTLDKLTKKMYNINVKINECSDYEKDRLYGELLISNIYRLKDFNKNSYETNSKKNNEINLKVENYYDNNNLIEIKVQKNLSIEKNAEKYFKKYNKKKATLEIIKKQKMQTEKELSYLESVIEEIDNCSNISELNDVYDEINENILFNEYYSKRKIKKEGKNNKQNSSMLTNYMKFKVDDYDVLVGKNNKQNDYLTLKVANENDYWFHTKDIHGSHLILRCNGQMPRKETIVKCAEIVAYYSKARYSSHVPVDYTKVKYVKKPKGSMPRFCYIYE